MIGTTKAAEPISPPIPTKPKNRKPSSKASDIFPEPLAATESSHLPGSQHYMKTQKITSPLNTPSVRDHLTSYPSPASSHFPFQHTPTHLKTDTSTVDQTVSNGVSNPVSSKNSTTVSERSSPKEVWKSPPVHSTAKKSEKNEVAVNNSTKTTSNSDTKSGNKSSSGSNIAKKRKTSKAGNADEDSKKKQKTHSNQEKKTSYPISASGRGKMPVLPPSPFSSKSSGASSIRDM